MSKRRLQVYECLVNFAPCTSSEAIRQSKATFGVFGVSSRFTELRDLGAIEELGTKTCSITGRNVIEWGITGYLPKKIDKKNSEFKPSKKIIKFIINKMNNEQTIFVDKYWLEDLIK